GSPRGGGLLQEPAGLQPEGRVLTQAPGETHPRGGHAVEEVGAVLGGDVTVETVGETTEASAPGVLRPAQALRRRVRHGAQPQRAAGDRDGVWRTLGAPSAAPRVVELDPVLPRRTQRGALELV